eukprot:5178200-Prymnesium_polylepis.1
MAPCTHDPTSPALRQTDPQRTALAPKCPERMRIQADKWHIQHRKPNWWSWRTCPTRTEWRPVCLEGTASATISK